ncbi:MAG: hypothetical protein ABH843_08520, partial [Candidatus Omnitrophota bacterium]
MASKLLRIIFIIVFLLMNGNFNITYAASERRARYSYMARRMAAELYNDASRFYEQQEYEMAYEKFKKAQNLYPNYDRSKYYLRQISNDLMDKKQQEKLIKERDLKKTQTTRQAKANELYREAVWLYREDKSDEAVEKFKNAYAISPDYDRSKFYLRELHKRMKENQDILKLKKFSAEKAAKDAEKKREAELESKKEEERLVKLEAERLEEERKAKEKEAEKDAELKRKQELDEKRKKIELEEERKREQKAKEESVKKQVDSLYNEA